jgi:copper homeostasis protein
MKQKYILEISVDSIEAARAAERGGADRIELCSNLSAGGITPADGVMFETRADLQIPIFAMIRPRAGDFLYSDGEFATMRASIRRAYHLQLDGVVLGILTPENRVDVERTQELVKLASPLQVTFHRAFDRAIHLRKALEDVVRTGAQRILTSGGAKDAPEGAAVLGRLVAAAGDRITIVPGAGINAANISLIVERTDAVEFHSGLSTALPYGSNDYEKFETEVRKLAKQLASLA